MNQLDPYLRELSDDLAMAWQSNSRKLMQARIDELSQTNQLQLGLAERLTVGGIVQLRLITGEYLNGNVNAVGIDAVLIRTSLTLELVPISSLVSVSRVPRAKNLTPVRRLLFLPTLIKSIQSNIIIQSRLDEVCSGKLLSVWRDCFDVISENGPITFSISSVLKLSLSDAQ